jgi:hypothetical protein
MCETARVQRDCRATEEKLGKDRIQWLAVVITAINHPVPK